MHLQSAVTLFLFARNRVISSSKPTLLVVPGTKVFFGENCSKNKYFARYFECFNVTCVSSKMAERYIRSIFRIVSSLKISHEVSIIQKPSFVRKMTRIIYLKKKRNIQFRNKNIVNSSRCICEERVTRRIEFIHYSSIFSIIFLYP